MEPGTHVKKVRGMKFVGTVLARYFTEGKWWIVVKLDPNEASDSLQHLYPEDLFEPVL
jgi:hypothetical protein